ncbi:MAG: methyl-accepting chemotaxis protein [Proteobacteria bacterium]|nr:methyl-accepting chemotaxis protein [Pseudomonadota bacterium]
MSNNAIDLTSRIGEMLSSDTTSHLADLEAQVAAISKVQAVIEFGLDGIIRNANENFLKTLGYTLEEIKGKHHRMFCDPSFANSQEYRDFWDKLARGEFESKEYKRIGKGGKEVWIHASYNPICDTNGRPYKVIKFAVDISHQKLKDAQLAALSKTQALIEFTPDGTILDANENFLKTVDYRLEEIKNKHHSMFCAPDFVQSHKYKEFWNRLANGEFQTDQYQRFGKNGKSIWLQAFYIPVLDNNGKVFKVVKYATDITAQKNAQIIQDTNLARTQSMMENMPINVLMADRDFNIIYINPKSRDTLKTIERDLPVSVDKIQGNSIDIFHRNPSFQRKILGDDRNLPHRAKIKLGSNTLDLLVSATYDSNKNYIGPMVTWELITARVELVSNIGEASQKLAAASAELNATATQMSGNAEKSTSVANATASASEEVSQGVRTVATNTEEMSAAIKEIARNASEASTTSAAALKQAQQTNITIIKLGESSQEIGNVIKVISSIAQQTNLLALNATIEAARAGDAGRGFAVVANEVKELAKQTAKATEDITNKITGIQRDSQSSVDAVTSIGHTIEKLNSIASAIAASVEEQAATTNEVSRVVQESAKGVLTITENVKIVSTAAKETYTGSNQVLTAAKSLSELASSLEALVKRIEI